MIGAALGTELFSHARGEPRTVHYWVGMVANVALPAAAVFALTLAVRRVRGRVRIADGFFSLVLLNPLFYARVTEPFDTTVLAAGLLGLLAGAIVATISAANFAIWAWPFWRSVWRHFPIISS